LLGAARGRLRHCWARRKQHGGNQGISKSHFILLFLGPGNCPDISLR
jgi:hypothetical protein